MQIHPNRKKTAPLISWSIYIFILRYFSIKPTTLETPDITQLKHVADTCIIKKRSSQSAQTQERETNCVNSQQWSIGAIARVFPRVFVLVFRNSWSMNK